MPLLSRSSLAVALGFASTSAATAETGVDPAPFSARSQPAGPTMFTLLPPEQTGIRAENSFADPQMWNEHYQEFTLGAMGTGVCTGDYDNDGRPDVFVVNKTGQSRLFRNLGNWKFEDSTEKAGLLLSGEKTDGGGSWVKNLMGDNPSSGATRAWTQGATFADVNNDGWLDLYVCRFKAANLLYINQRNGTFKEEAAARGLALVDASGVGAFCDYDRDGWLDVYIQTNMLNAAVQPNGRRDYLFRNRGDGTFQDVTTAAGIYGDTLVHSTIWWDYDQDGWPDIYVADDFASPDRLYRNNRDGTFTDVIHQVVPQMPYSAMGADLGDVNNDGRIDLIVADMAATTHEKDQRSMARARELNREDSDSPTLSPQVLRSTLYLNTGTGRMLEVAQLAGVDSTDWTWSPRFEDLDNDGRIDLHITNGTTREYHNVELRDRIILTESVTERVRLMKDSSVLNERNLAYRNLGDLKFEEVGKAWGLDQDGVSFGSAFADFDGDGDLDLIYANHEANPTVLRNDSTTGNRILLALRGTSSNRFGVGAVAKVETSDGMQVRALVLARGYLSGSDPVLHFGLGDASTIQRLTVEWPSGHTQVLENLPANRRYTVVEPAGPAQIKNAAPPPAPQFVEVGSALGLSTLRIEETFEAERQPLLPFRFDRRGPALAVGDLDGDGVDDLALGGTSKQPAQLLRGGPSFTPVAVQTAVRVDNGPVLLFDANGDGAPDLLETKAGTNRPSSSPEYQPTLSLNDGSGQMVPATDVLPALTTSAGAAAAADFDRDGRLDVFIGGRVLPGKYPSAPKSALWQNRGGRFEDVTDQVAPGLQEVGMVTAAVWSDLDQDGWVDLLIALDWGGVRYFHNDSGRSLVDASDQTGFGTGGTGWWTSLCTADFNGDGRPDVAAGNNGLNTPYRSSAVAFYGRFTPGNALQFIEAEEEAGRLYPRRTSRTLGAVIPEIKRRYPSNDGYARATLSDLFGAERLGSARRLEAKQMQSGLFLSGPGGNYTFQPLPRIAQIAPVQGMVAGDFDADGNADLFLVHNSYAPIPSIGRFSGGLGQLLRGDGRGGLDPIPPLQSGLVVPGDAKALSVVDFDSNGWPDFVVTRNDAPLLAFKNAGVAGRHMLRVALRGPDGNRTGVGARVTLLLANGRSQTREVQAGTGYYSQSSAHVFFGYSGQNAPRKLRVRWPDGHESEHPVPSPTPKTWVVPSR